VSKSECRKTMTLRTKTLPWGIPTTNGEYLEAERTSTQAADREHSEAERPSGQTTNGEQSEAGRAARQTAVAGQPGSESLIAESEVSDYRGRWDTIQGNFVDDPKKSVTEADNLVGQVIESVTSRFAEQRQKLESQWSQGSDASTEDLRLALQQYRAFFERLLVS
jgi:hypothetical protein